jgi:hypothetical protein
MSFHSYLKNKISKFSHCPKQQTKISVFRGVGSRLNDKLRDGACTLLVKQAL